MTPQPHTSYPPLIHASLILSAPLISYHSPPTPNIFPHHNRKTCPSSHLPSPHFRREYQSIFIDHLEAQHRNGYHDPFYTPHSTPPILSPYHTHQTPNSIFTRHDDFHITSQTRLWVNANKRERLPSLELFTHGLYRIKQGLHRQLHKLTIQLHLSPPSSISHTKKRKSSY